MRIKALVFFLLAPLLAWGQIAVTAPGEPISIGAGVRLSIPAYDVDAISYFVRAGVTDPTAKRQISDFVKGVKALGLWSNMVCWPLRSSQNAGTGTTVYSLGGLGTYNGTMVNGPTWGATGITFARASSQRIITGSSIVAANSAHSIATAAVHVNTAQQYHTAVSLGNGRASEIYAQSNGSTDILGYAWNAAGAGTGNFSNSAFSTLNYFFGLNTADASGYDFWWNGTQYRTAAGDYRIDPTPATLATIGVTNIGLGSYSNYFNGTISFGFVANVRITSGQRSALYSLYKSTLGQGLGLP